MEKDIISVVRKEESSLSKLRRVPFAPNVIVCGGVREAKVITAKASMWNVVSSAGHCLGNGRAHCVILEFRWGFFYWLHGMCATIRGRHTWPERILRSKSSK